MIAYLGGHVYKETESDSYKTVVIAPVGSEGVGYQVLVPLNTIFSDDNPYNDNKTKFAQLIIHTVLTERSIELYGFSSEEEKELFFELCKVKSIGNKKALAILSLGHELIMQAVKNNDKKFIMQAKGVGSAVADMIITKLLKA